MARRASTTSRRHATVDPQPVHVRGQIFLPGLDEQLPVDFTEPELVAWYERRDERELDPATDETT